MRHVNRASFAALVILAVGMSVPVVAQPEKKKPDQPAQDPLSGPKVPDSAVKQGQRPETMMSQPQRQPGQQGQDGDRREIRSVEQGMKGMGRLLRSLSETVSKSDGGSSQRAEAIRMINELQRIAVTAKGMTPKKASDEKDAAKRDEMMLVFRRELIELTRLFLQTELDMLDGKWDSVKSNIEAIKKRRDSAHGVMKVDDDE